MSNFVHHLLKECRIFDAVNATDNIKIHSNLNAKKKEEKKTRNTLTTIANIHAFLLYMQLKHTRFCKYGMQTRKTQNDNIIDGQNLYLIQSQIGSYKAAWFLARYRICLRNM